MFLKTIVRRYFCLVLFAVLTLLVACSDHRDAAVTTFSLSSPARIAALDSDTLLITDFGANKFCTVDKLSLQIVNCFSAKGKPTGIAYADYKGGRYFVGNRSVRSVDMFDSHGSFIGHLGGGTGLFGLVNDLAINRADGSVYVLDSKAAIVSIYDFDGRLVVKDFTPGGLDNPSALSLGPDGKVYISDFGTADDFNDQSIKIFDKTGVLIDSILSGGSSFKSPAFTSPQGLFIDGSSNIFMADSGLGTIFIYDSSFTFIKNVGERGSEPGQLFYPLGLFVDEVSRNIFISDNRNGRVTVLLGAGVVP
ncbi:MAG: NHL repeat-containing protein [Desulfuromonadales bacterium]|nr:NHL repeat-containing protein [Desulfuromonadales bacterium]